MSVLYSDPDNRPHVHGYHALLEGFERVKSFVDQKGLRMTPGCRLELYSRTLTLLADPIDDRSEIVSISKVVGELHQVISIVDWLNEDPALPKEFEFLFGGKADDFFTPRTDPARDRQFELYVAASLKRAGAQVRLAEPDVVAEIRGRSIPIAVKRPKSEDAACDLIRNGRRQLQRSGMQGLIAVDLSIFPIEGLLLSFVCKAPAHVPRTSQMVLKQLLDRVGADFVRAAGIPKYAPTVAGTLYFINVPMQIEEPWIGTAGRAWGMQVHDPEFRATGELIVAALTTHEVAIQAHYSQATPPGDGLGRAEEAQ